MVDKVQKSLEGNIYSNPYSKHWHNYKVFISALGLFLEYFAISHMLTLNSV